MAEIIPLQGKRIFSLAEAQYLLPLVKRLTAEAIVKAERLLNRIEPLLRNEPTRLTLERELNRHIEDWARKMERLGGEAKGLWLVDFDSGSGYYCWQYGDAEIGYFHGYAEGFAGRRRLDLL
jgi:hypothetical protein